MTELRPEEIPVIIPSYEPDGKLPALLQELSDGGFENIIIVDDGSGEAYKSIFDEADSFSSVTLLHHAVNMGKGRALKTAFDYVLCHFPDAIGAITADSDGQHSPECIRACAEALIENPGALIMGCRSFDGDDVPARSQFGNKLTRRVMKYLVGVSVSDTQTGLRGISASFMKSLLTLKGERFEFETNMLMETKKLGIQIIEVPIKTIYIEDNRTSHFNPIKDSIRIYMTFGKFLFSSLSSSVLDLCLFSIFCALLKGRDLHMLNYITLSTVMARLLSAAYNYMINYKLVFESRGSLIKTLSRYVLLAVCQMSLSALLVNIIYPYIGGFETFVKIPVDIMLFFLSYVIQREFVY
ncbi:MAG: glycosyltransferase [Lachnospiraceae bacterium]|nr:glycosyltransferase [Lachnospiraceae bacterium]MDY4999488.1 glycosyltransferase [Lachnospiraceae bacterium]